VCVCVCMRVCVYVCVCVCVRVCVCLDLTKQWIRSRNKQCPSSLFEKHVQANKTLFRRPKIGFAFTNLFLEKNTIFGKNTNLFLFLEYKPIFGRRNSVLLAPSSTR